LMLLDYFLLEYVNIVGMEERAMVIDTIIVL